MLVLKLTLVPAFVLLLTLASRALGPTLAGWLAGLPVVAGPILYLLTLEHGSAFAATAAGAAGAGVAASMAFGIAYARMAVRGRWPASLACALAAWLVAAVILSLMPAHPAVNAAVALVALRVSPGLFPASTAVGAAVIGPAQVVARMFAGAVLTFAVSTVAARLGPVPGGVATVFPVLSIVLVVFSHGAGGGPYSVALLRGLAAGLYGFAAFCLLLSVLLPRIAAPAAFAIAAAVCIAVHGLSGYWVRPRSGARV